MKQFFLIISTLLLLNALCIYGQDDGPSEQCIRCLCHARTGCFRIRNCASYSIGLEYWKQASRPVVLDDDPNNDASYNNCISDDTCVMNAIRGYIRSKDIKDCNCDGAVMCKDYAAIHLKGDNCRTPFDTVQLQRLERCLRDRNIPEPPGWTLECDAPGAV